MRFYQKAKTIPCLDFIIELCRRVILPRRPTNDNFKSLNYLYILPFLCYNESIPTAEWQTMNRNNVREIGARLVVLRDYLFANADKTRAISIEHIRKAHCSA